MKRKLNQYKIEKLLGDGHSGYVYLAENCETGFHVAYKCSGKNAKPGAIGKEIDILRRFNHPNLVEIEDLVQDAVGVYTGYVMPYYPEGDLYHFVQKGGASNEHLCRRLITQLISALQSLHQANIAHRDIKLENILMGSDCTIRLADFGFATEVSRQDSTCIGFCGTRGYLAPELADALHSNQCRTVQYQGCAVDIWGAGVVAYMLCTGLPPYDEEDTAADWWYNELVCDRHERFWLAHERYIPSLSNKLKNCINGMLCADVSRRSTAEKLQAHPWITGMAKDNTPSLPPPPPLLLPPLMPTSVPDDGNCGLGKNTTPVAKISSLDSPNTTGDENEDGGNAGNIPTRNRPRTTTKAIYSCSRDTLTAVDDYHTLDSMTSEEKKAECGSKNEEAVAIADGPTPSLSFSPSLSPPTSPSSISPSKGMQLLQVQRPIEEAN